MLGFIEGDVDYATTGIYRCYGATHLPRASQAGIFICIRYMTGSEYTVQICFYQDAVYFRVSFVGNCVGISWSQL